MTDQPTRPEDELLVRALADLAGLPLPNERLSLLAAMFKSTMADYERLAALDLDEAEPPAPFHAAWD